jgi:hypothetical protein
MSPRTASRPRMARSLPRTSTPIITSTS